MTAPLNSSTVDAAQIEQFLKMLYEGAPGMPAFASYPEKGQKEGRFEWGFYPGDAVSRIVERCRARNEEELRAVAMSMATFWGNDRRESSVVSLAAFAIDIDQKDLDNLVGGASEPSQVIPEILARLQARGLKPHAIVNSGNGLHVYVLFDRIFFERPGWSRSPLFDRERVKKTWEKLAHLLGATDRFDLSSIMRVPGTVNRKYGGFKRVSFLAEHTDLTRESYSFEEIEKAVADVVVTQARRQKTTGSSSGTSAKQVVTTPLHGWQKRMVDYAVAQDPKFKALRDGARIGRFGKKTDRSNIEFEYACRLLEMGFPERVVWAEICGCAKGSEAGYRYVDSTILAAATKVSGENFPRTTVSFDCIENTSSAFYTWKKYPGGFLSPVPVVNWSLPNVTAVMARPGGSKTTDLLDILSTSWSGVGTHDRVGVCGLFVTELLDHEYFINAAFPAGMRFEEHGRLAEFNRNALPTSAKEIHEALPEDIRSFSRGGQQVWTKGRLEQHSAPRALLLNAISPYATDERFQVEEPVLPHSRYPNAVVKFRAREDLCLAGHSQHTLDTTPICSKECLLTQCRSNMTENGMRTIWNNASVALLTHKSFEAQVLYQPKKNDFECIIFDELPQFVYRNSPIKLWPDGALPRAPWHCDPLDTIITKLREAVSKLREDLAKVRAEIADARAKNDEDRLKHLGKKRRKLQKHLDAVPPILDRLERRRGLLLKQAQKAKAERTGEFERMAARGVEPLLNNEQYEALVSLQRESRTDDDLDEYEEEDLGLLDEDEDEDGTEEDDTCEKVKLGSLLPRLRDFCADEDLVVYYEHTFTKKTRGSFCMYRPVNGWGDLVLRPGGEGRRVVVLDATAGLDPRYLLLGVAQTEETPSGWYPNTTVVLTSKHTITKSKVENPKVTALDLSGRIVRDVGPYRAKIESLLVITSKKLAPKLRKEVAIQMKEGTLPPHTFVEHFGNLRGRNQYRDFDAVCLTHLHRYHEAAYAGLNFLLRPFESFPGKWEDKNATEGENGRRVWDSVPLRLRAMISDLFQDTMRIGLRSNPDRECFIFVPSAEPAVVARLMHLFRGATFVHPAKKAGRSARIAATPSDPLGDVFGVADVPANGKPKLGRAIRDDLDGHGAQAWGVEKKKLLDAEASKPAPPEPPGPREVPTGFWDINMPHVPGELAREGREQLRLVVQGLWNFVRRDAPNEAACSRRCVACSGSTGPPTSFASRTRPKVPRRPARTRPCSRS